MPYGLPIIQSTSHQSRLTSSSIKSNLLSYLLRKRSCLLIKLPLHFVYHLNAKKPTPTRRLEKEETNGSNRAEASKSGDGTLSDGSRSRHDGRNLSRLGGVVESSGLSPDGEVGDGRGSAGLLDGRRGGSNDDGLEGGAAGSLGGHEAAGAGDLGGKAAGARRLDADGRSSDDDGLGGAAGSGLSSNGGRGAGRRGAGVGSVAKARRGGLLLVRDGLVRDRLVRNNDAGGAVGLEALARSDGRGGEHGDGKDVGKHREGGRRTKRR